MILTYKDCIEKYGSDHLLKKEIAERVFTNSTYKKQVERSRKNWLDMSVEEVLKKDLEFVQGIQ